MLRKTDTVRRTEKLFRVLFLSGCLAVPGVGRLTAVDVRGRVINGTTGKALGGIELYVMKPGPRGMQAAQTLHTDGQGKFSVSGDDLLESPHVLQVEYRGVNYNRVLRPGPDLSDLELKVYEITDSMDGIQVSLPHMMIRRDGDVLRVDEVYQVENESDPKKSFVSSKGSFRFYLPEEMSRLIGLALLNPNSTLPIQQTPNENEDGQGYNLTNPLKPGRTQIQVSYEVDYADSHAHVPKRFFYPLEVFNLFLSPEDIQVGSDVLREAGIDRQNHIRMLTANAIPADQEIRIDVSGGSRASRAKAADADPSRRIEIVPPDIERYRVLIIVNLSVLLAAFVGWRLTSRETSQPSKPVKGFKRGGSRVKLMRRREALLDQLAQLDDQWDSKVLPAEEYRQRRQTLKQQLIKMTGSLNTKNT